MLRKATESGAEPPKPALTVAWPPDLDERDPNLDDPRLPIALPTILGDLETIRRTEEADGGRLLHDVLRVAGLPWNGGGSGARRRPAFLPEHDPSGRSATRTCGASQTSRRACSASAPFGAYDLDYIDVASAYPRDPRLFEDAIHMTHAGIRLQAWIVFNGLVPTIERRLAGISGRGRRRCTWVEHPAFNGPSSSSRSRRCARRVGESGIHPSMSDYLFIGPRLEGVSTLTTEALAETTRAPSRRASAPATSGPTRTRSMLSPGAPASTAS